MGRDEPGELTVGRAWQTVGVGLSGLLSGAVSYVALVLAAHTLTPAHDAVFLAYWALLFGTYGVVTGVQPETARASFAEGSRLERGSGVRLLPVAVGVGTAVGLVLALTGAAWADRVLGSPHGALVLVVAAAAIAYSGQLAVSGVLAGRGAWDGVTLVNVCESAIRLSCVLAACLALTGSVVALAVASAVSSAAWLLMLARADVRSALSARGVALTAQLGHFAHACVASASSAALVVGFPVLVRVTSSSGEYLGAAGLLMAISLTRAPLMLPLAAYQSVAVTHFMRHRDDGARALVPIAAVVAVVTAIGAALAAVVGPLLFTAMVGERYAMDGTELSGLTVGAGLLALLTLTGACCLALGEHRIYSSGWLAATAVAALLLLAPAPLDERVLLALLAGPASGCLVHLRAVILDSRAKVRRRGGPRREVA